MAEEAAGQEEAAVRPQPPLHRGLAEELGALPEQRGPGGLAGGEARVARAALPRRHRFVCEVGFLFSHLGFRYFVLYMYVYMYMWNFWMRIDLVV